MHCLPSVASQQQTAVIRACARYRTSMPAAAPWPRCCLHAFLQIPNALEHGKRAAPGRSGSISALHYTAPHLILILTCAPSPGLKREVRPMRSTFLATICTCRIKHGGGGSRHWWVTWHRQGGCAQGLGKGTSRGRGRGWGCGTAAARPRAGQASRQPSHLDTRCWCCRQAGTTRPQHAPLPFPSPQSRSLDALSTHPLHDVLCCGALRRVGRLVLEESLGKHLCPGHGAAGVGWKG